MRARDFLVISTRLFLTLSDLHSKVIWKNKKWDRRLAGSMALSTGGWKQALEKKSSVRSSLREGGTMGLEFMIGTPSLLRRGQRKMTTSQAWK